MDGGCCDHGAEVRLLGGRRAAGCGAGEGWIAWAGRVGADGTRVWTCAVPVAGGGRAAQSGRPGWELTGPPEVDQVGEMIEQAGEGGKDEGVQRRHRPVAVGIVACVGVDAGGEAGDTTGQGWGLGF